MKKSKTEIIVLILWIFIFLYTVNKLQIPKNTLYIFIGLPILLSGIFGISYLFNKSQKQKKPF